MQNKCFIDQQLIREPENFSMTTIPQRGVYAHAVKLNVT